MDPASLLHRPPASPLRLTVLLSTLAACGGGAWTWEPGTPTPEAPDTSVPRATLDLPTHVAPPIPTTPPDLVWTGDIASYAGCVDGDPEAKVLSIVPPAALVTAGAPVPGEVVYANCGSSPWIAALTVDAFPGVKLGAVSDTVMHTWGRPRVLLPQDIAPGQAVRLSFEGTSPMVNGAHPWQWQLLDEWVRWIDAPTPVSTIEVQGGFGPFIVHSRFEWETTEYPVDGSDLDLLDLEFITVHYNGANKNLGGEDGMYTDADTIESLRDSQREYIEGRGYSLGYNSEIAPDGDEWEIRGYEFHAAANGCTEVNEPSYSIQVPTATPETPPLPAQIEGLRAAILRVRQAAAAAGNPNFLYLNGHRDVRPLCDGLSGTSCPGEALYAMIQDGSLEP